MHRFVSRLNTFKAIGNYSLQGHYCNCAVVAGRYMVFSFWPYEEEAMRTIWGCLKVSREQEKELKEMTKECEDLKKQLIGKDEEVRNLNLIIQNKTLQVEQAQRQVRVAQKLMWTAQHDSHQAKQQMWKAKQDTRKAQQETRTARIEAQKSEGKWRRMQQMQERERTERLRLRDPIHIYALQGGTSGLLPEDWKLVLDYHKGAHGIELGQPRSDGTQSVQFKVDNLALHFDLVVPQDVRTLSMQLPLQPSELCPDF